MRWTISWDHRAVLTLQGARGWGGYTRPELSRIWGIWGSYYNIPKARFYVLKGGYIVS